MLLHLLRASRRRTNIQPTFHKTLHRTMATSQTPMEDAIRSKVRLPHDIDPSISLSALTKPHQLTASLSPTNLQIANDSASHAHHAAMASNKSRETHFRLVIVSDSFKGKSQPARHRLVYACLADELAREGGVHALQLSTRTVEEEERRQGTGMEGG